MSRQEAIEAMKRGEKVTHRFFEPHEWITIEGHGIRFTQGFWPDRTGNEWETDWEIYKRKPKLTPNE